ncbi:MAG: ATP-binding protein [Treponema sp.]|uniref:ATP-binding protein n=1 Tax=Treponema sp. TaxID=166 RepID=UPI002A909164|nr:ATP-binding protein [Treponema sp.]MDY6397742.1 ATP-binding protein [Treponema sp.]
MEIRETYRNDREITSNEVILNFEDKALSSYIYANNFQEISLGTKELEKVFLRTALSYDNLVSLSNIYLRYLEKSNTEKFKELEKGKGEEKGFDLDDVLSALSKDLLSNYRETAFVLFAFERYNETKYLKTNPLKEILERPYIQDFFKGLKLSAAERKLFVLAVAHEDWGWLFPDFKNDEYKANLFCHICSINKKDKLGYVRKLNSHLIQLGLFSSPWKVQNYVYSFFKNENPSFTLQEIHPDGYCDVYDYQELCELNSDSLELIKKIRGFTVISSDSNFRNRNFLAEYFRGQQKRVFELTAEFEGTGRNEMKFYIYALSKMIDERRSVLFINENSACNLLDDGTNSPEKSFFRIKERFSSILENVTNPVIISAEQFTETERTEFSDNGIDVLYSLNLKLPKEKRVQEKATDYFCEHKLSPDYLSVVVNECEKLNIQPEEWPSILKLFNHSTDLSPVEAENLLENKYGHKNNQGNLRKNSHYCIEALNTSEPIFEITDALKNADEYQNGEYDEESGIKILLYGISGGGKTAYAEEISKKINRNLKIVRPAEVLGKYVGETEQNISRIFKEAAEEHAVLLVDEADSFLHPRGDNVNHHNDSKVNSFLIEIERYPGILFCSTNLPDNLDKALDRRFNFKVGFNPLTKDGVSLLCKSYFSSINMTDSQVSQIFNAGDVTPGDFASLNGKIRFLPPEKRNAEFITEELCKIVRGKTRSYDSKKIGFGA